MTQLCRSSMKKTFVPVVRPLHSEREARSIFAVWDFPSKHTILSAWHRNFEPVRNDQSSLFIVRIGRPILYGIDGRIPGLVIATGGSPLLHATGHQGTASHTSNQKEREDVQVHLLQKLCHVMSSPPIRRGASLAVQLEVGRCLEQKSVPVHRTTGGS